MIGIFTVVSTIQQQKLSTQQREQDKQDAFLLRQHSERQADNVRKESVFVIYLDDVSKLLMLENQTKSLVHIRMNTLASLRHLDPERKKHLLLFLYENQLLHSNSQQPSSSLLKVNGADFNGIYFQGSKEVRCSFIGLYLHDAQLSNSSFLNCQMWFSNFSNSIMYNSAFCNTDLRGSSFNLALLDKANFSRANLYDVKFVSASLVECDFTGARWPTGKVNFTNANLTRAIISNEQLLHSTVYNCVLPNGTWGPIQSKNLVVNGDVEQNCTTNVNNNLTGWTVSSDGEIKVIAYENKNTTEQFGKCYIRLISFYGSKISAFASQTIDLSIFSMLISNGIARYNASVNFQCSGNHYGSIELFLVDMNGLRHNATYKSTGGGTRWQSLHLSGIVYSDVRSAWLRITLAKLKTNIPNTPAPIEEYFCACDNVKFSITKS